MSTTHKIATVISAAIATTPALSALDATRVYADNLPVNVKVGVTINGIYNIEGKSRQRGATLHLWMPMPDKETAGDIEDMADALLAALRGTAILPSNWIRQPDDNAKMDHIVFPVVVYLDLLK